MKFNALVNKLRPKMYLSEGTIKLTQNHTFIRQRILGRQGNNCGLQSVANSLDVGNRSLDHYILSISWQMVFTNLKERDNKKYTPSPVSYFQRNNICSTLCKDY